jgi:hypothetical protein
MKRSTDIKKSLNNKQLQAITLCKFHSGVRVYFSDGFSLRSSILADKKEIRNPLRNLAPERYPQFG